MLVHARSNRHGSLDLLGESPFRFLPKLESAQVQSMSQCRHSFRNGPFGAPCASVAFTIKAEELPHFLIRLAHSAVFPNNAHTHTHTIGFPAPSRLACRLHQDLHRIGELGRGSQRLHGLDVGDRHQRLVLRGGGGGGWLRRLSVFLGSAWTLFPKILLQSMGLHRQPFSQSCPWPWEKQGTGHRCWLCFKGPPSRKSTGQMSRAKYSCVKSGPINLLSRTLSRCFRDPMFCFRGLWFL